MINYTQTITAIHLVESSPVDLYLLSGKFTELRTSSGNISANRIIRIDSTGNKDNAFNYGTGFPGSTIGARVIVFQTNGKYLLGGGFTSYNGTTADRIVRLNQDGTRGQYIELQKVVKFIKLNSIKMANNLDPKDLVCVQNLIVEERKLHKIN